MAQRPWLVLVTILVLAAGLRLYAIGDSCFWLDEFCSMETSTGRGLAHVELPRNQWLTDAPRLTSLDNAPPVWRIWTSLKDDSHPPLYFIVLRLWRTVCGDGEVTTRLLSVLVSLVSIALLYDTIRLQFDRTSAAWASLLAAVAMSQIHYGQEARAYAMAGALALGACDALARLETLGLNRRRVIALGFCVLSMPLTHYFAITGAMALFIYAAIALRGRVRQAALLAILSAGAVFAVVWGPWFIQQQAGREMSNAWQIEPAVGHVQRTVVRAAITPLRWLSEAAAVYLPTYATVALGIVLIAFFIWRCRGRQRLWSVWALVPLLLIAVLDLKKSTKLLDLLRYTLLGSWGLFVIVADQSGLRWRRHVLPAIAVLICLASIPFAYSSSQDWAILGRYLGENVKPADAVVYSSDGWDDWYAGALYLGTTYYGGPPPSPHVLMTQPLSAEVLQQLHGRRTVWLIAGSQKPADQLLPGFAVEESANFLDIGMIWKLRPR